MDISTLRTMVDVSGLIPLIKICVKPHECIIVGACFEALLYSPYTQYKYYKHYNSIMLDTQAIKSSKVEVQVHKNSLWFRGNILYRCWPHPHLDIQTCISSSSNIYSWSSSLHHPYMSMHSPFLLRLKDHTNLQV